MSVPDSVASKRWMAAGVRHEVLMRAMPSLRHDMAAPVSILRMATLLLKYQLAATPIDAAACAQRVTVVDEQMGGLVDGIRLLRGWESSATAGEVFAHDTVTTPVLVAKCVSLLRPLFDLGGISITLDPALEEPALPVAAPETSWPDAFALRYLVLASLCHLHDAHADMGAVHIAPQGADALELRSVARAAGALPPMANLMPIERRLEIDEAALQCLADDLGFAVESTVDGVRLRLSAI